MLRNHVVTTQGSSPALPLFRRRHSMGGRLASCALIAALVLGLLGYRATHAQGGAGFTLAISPEG